MTRNPGFVASLLLLAATAACNQVPTAPQGVPTDRLAFKGGPPASCDAFAPLSVVLADGPGDGLTSDGGGAYAEGVDGVEAHINGPTGNLSIWTTASPRSLVAQTGNGPIVIDRVYTNNHSVQCGLQLSTLPVGSITTAVLEAEERAGGTGGTVSIVRYGKDCSKGQGKLDGNPATVSRPDASTIVITAGSGNYCLKAGGQNWTPAGTVAGFTMTLSAL